MLEYIALGSLIFMGFSLLFGAIAIVDIPYNIAVERNHPHQDAIRQAGWISLFTLHVIWPFLWIWATLYREDRGWGFQTQGSVSKEAVAELKAEIHTVSERVKTLESTTEQ